jgi:hypothetical protein
MVRSQADLIWPEGYILFNLMEDLWCADAALEIHLPEWRERETRQADKSRQADTGRQADRGRQTDIRQKNQDARSKTGVKLKGTIRTKIHLLILLCNIFLTKQ